ncbi:hypothetical protein GCK32_004681 [Trichostrongylus colubriformis]|uniref:Uncharacterized protein n=1 Tax=Trichostrongylus colubriformis TaxID=6319 RepID=A0AAN8G9U4_TRICO
MCSCIMSRYLHTTAHPAVTMKGRTLSPVSIWRSSYVQINIYGTSLRELREEGVDIKHMLQHIGYRSLVMDVPILSSDSQSYGIQPVNRRIKSFGGFNSHFHTLKFEENCAIDEVTLNDMSAVSATPIDSFASCSGDVRKGPLTSTPVGAKLGGCFEDFIMSSPCGASQKVARLSTEIPVETSLAKNDDRASTEETYGAVDDVLFQDCLHSDEFDVDLANDSRTTSQRNPPARLSGANDVASAAVRSAVGNGFDKAAYVVSTEACAKSSVMSSCSVENIVITKSSFITPPVADIGETDNSEDTVVADLLSDPLPSKIRQGIEVEIEDEAADLNTAVLYCGFAEENDTRCPYSEANRHLDDRRQDTLREVPNGAVINEKKFDYGSMDCPSENEGSGNNMEEMAIGEIINGETMKEMSSCSLRTSTEATPAQKAEAIVSSVPPSTDTADKQFSTLNDVDGIAAQLEEASISYESTSAWNKIDASSSSTKSTEPNALHNRSGRKRARCSSNNLNPGESKFEQEERCSDEIPEMPEAEDAKLVAEKNTKIFHCHMPGCGKKLLWRSRYGKNRLVDHVRTHWKTAVKLCKICDYKAPSPRQVYHHHKVNHGSVPYMGATSLETTEDMEELLRLWKQCFPGHSVRIKWIPPTFAYFPSAVTGI